MAKTIFEMANEYASKFMDEVNKLDEDQRKWLSRHPNEPHPTGGIKACFIFQRQAYLHGANDVLEEIESILDAPMNYVVESGWQGKLNDVAGMIRQRINELKR